jgi:hypothetical protein
MQRVAGEIGHDERIDGEHQGLADGIRQARPTITTHSAQVLPLSSSPPSSALDALSSQAMIAPRNTMPLVRCCWSQ